MATREAQPTCSQDPLVEQRQVVKGCQDITLQVTCIALVCLLRCSPGSCVAVLTSACLQACVCTGRYVAAGGHLAARRPQSCPAVRLQNCVMRRCHTAGDVGAVVVQRRLHQSTYTGAWPDQPAAFGAGSTLPAVGPHEPQY
eukprot:GHRQ01026361.1.p1 GENE.GHRQ01026361.1~~GHRQ01026361.1.p1  ORF type:complete len:142 (-),score=16.94 GHRQ01026361.1:1186-1611(-)